MYMSEDTEFERDFRYSHQQSFASEPDVTISRLVCLVQDAVWRLVTYEYVCPLRNPFGIVIFESFDIEWDSVEIQPFDFDTKDTFVPDRSKEDWPKNMADADALWEKGSSSTS